MGKDEEGDKKEVKGWKGRGKDLPDQCQTASYAPAADGLPHTWRHVEMRYLCLSTISHGSIADSE